MMKLIVNGVEVTPCKKEKLTDHLTNVDIQDIIKEQRRKQSK
jgi:hypothetical protein